MDGSISAICLEAECGRTFDLTGVLLCVMHESHSGSMSLKRMVTDDVTGHGLETGLPCAHVRTVFSPIKGK